MSCEQFKEVNFHRKSREMITRVNGIIQTYGEQGLTLTLRQLYYQLVSANLIVNSEKSYKSLGSLVSDARLAGLVDWNAIEDRVRRPRIPLEFSNLQDLAQTMVAHYRLPRWADQDYYVELWVEKDALAGVLSPIASEYHVTMMVNRGYSSQSAMYEAGNRFKEAEENGKQTVLLYLGDHDPSGEDMVRDIKDRLEMFGVQELETTKVALTMAQIKQYNPPPNPAKMTDSRAKEYVSKHGHSSWEVDALPPNILATMIRTALDACVDTKRMNRIKRQEVKDKALLVETVKGLK